MQGNALRDCSLTVLRAHGRGDFRIDPRHVHRRRSPSRSTRCATARQRCSAPTAAATSAFTHATFIADARLQDNSSLHALAASRGACVTRCDLQGLPLLLVFRRERKPAPCPRPRRELSHTASPPTSHRTRAETFARFAKDPNLHTFSCMAGGHALRSPQPNSDLKFGLFAPPRKQRPAQP